jgi:uncharacterized membrane protein
MGILQNCITYVNCGERCPKTTINGVGNITNCNIEYTLVHNLNVIRVHCCTYVYKMHQYNTCFIFYRCTHWYTIVNLSANRFYSDVYIAILMYITISKQYNIDIHNNILVYKLID